MFTTSSNTWTFCIRPPREGKERVAMHDTTTHPDLADATESDLEGLLGIYNEVIANSTAVFANLPVTLDERRRWWQARTAQGYPVLVARDERGVAAFGSFSDFRAWPG